MPEKLTQPNKRKHAQKHGFLTRSKTHTGRLVIKRRRAAGRKRI